MKGKLQYIVPALLGIFFLFGIGVYGYLNSGEKQENYHVSVIVESDYSEHWTVLKQGIESGAKEFNTEVNFTMISSNTSVRECMDIMKRELKNGADGLILNLDTSEQLVKELDASYSDIQTVIMESEIPLAAVHTYIAPDNYQLGYDLGLALLEKHKAGETIGIVVGNKQRTANIERKNGFIRAVGEKNIQWIAEETYDRKDERLKELCTITPVDYIAGLNNEATEAIIDAQKEIDSAGMVFGIGNTDKAVYYLDKGLIDTLAVPNEFVMGYMCIKSMFSHLNYGTGEINQKTDYLLVNKDSLYSEENQKFLFPMVQ